MRNFSLKPIEYRHYPLLFKLWNNQSLIQYTYHQYTATIELAEASIQKTLSHYKHSYPDGGPYLIFEAQNFIGYCGIDQADETKQKFELWYIIDTEYHGNGFGSKVAQLLRNIAFEKMNAAFVVADVVRNNKASIRVLEKAKFKRIEELPMQFNRNGLTADLLKYSISKEDWLNDH